MNRHINRMLSVVLVGLMLVAGSVVTAKAQNVTVSYQDFYDNLSPYGQWVYDPDYGNVWVPYENGDFRPYGSNGQWVMTDYGNTWVSNDPWGWAVYHYGRWTYNPYYGWVWIPGYEWAPAWVSWRFGGGYAGWAPLGPGITVGMNYYAPDSWWIFIGPQYMYQPNCMRYWSGPGYNNTYIRQTTIINNYYMDNGTHVRYNYGPRANEVEQYTHHRVQVYSVQPRRSPGAPSISRSTVNIYRPSINRATVNEARPRAVVQAPRPIGRGQQQVQAGNGRPQFRQDMQNNQNGGGRGNYNNGGGRGNMPGNLPQQGRNTRIEMDTRSNNNMQQPSRFQQSAPDVRQEPARTQQPGRMDNAPRQMDNNNPGRSDVRQQEQPRQQMQPRQYDNRFDSRTREPQQSQPRQAQPQQSQPRQAQPQRPEPRQSQPQPRQEQPRQAQPAQNGGRHSR